MLTPRERLAHKLKDGRYRARKLGCVNELVTIAMVEHWLLHMFCHYCGDALIGIYALEHKEPLIKGGSHTLGNICLACMRCNELKHTESEADFLEYIKCISSL